MEELIKKLIKSKLFLRIIKPKLFKVNPETNEEEFKDIDSDDDDEMEDLIDSYKSMLSCCSNREVQRLKELDLKRGYNEEGDNINDKVDYFKNLPLKMRRDFVTGLRMNKLKNEKNFSDFMASITKIQEQANEQRF